jgi:DUF4097 and DUF4098 domain-containing protein YvlB
MEVLAIMMRTAVVRRIPVRVALIVAALLAGAAPAAAQPREGAFERTLKVTGAVDVNIQTGSGQIRVHPGATDTVRIAATLKSGGSWTSSDSDVEARIRKIEQNPPIEQQGNTITLGRFVDEELSRNISISYDVTVPAGTTVSASTGSGGIGISAVKGTVTASSGSGSIQVDGAAGLKAHTGSGSIHATGIAGVIAANSGSGSITIAQTGAGEVKVSAASGGVTLTGVNGAASVSSASGSITIDGRPVGPWSLNSASGGVSMTVPPDAAFDLDARTSSGSVSSVHPVTMSGEMEKRHIIGKVRGGGPLVKISTASGSIKIK